MAAATEQLAITVRFASVHHFDDKTSDDKNVWRVLNSGAPFA